MTNKVNVLGTDYTVEVHKVSEDKSLKDNHWSGYCNGITKKIVVADLTEDEFFDFENDKERELTRQEILRHEITHAFLNESGLQDSSMQYSGAWAHNEEMIDWFALQTPKLFVAYQTVGAI